LSGNENLTIEAREKVVNETWEGIKIKWRYLGLNDSSATFNHNHAFGMNVHGFCT
jgi:hypothetical protein